MAQLKDILHRSAAVPAHIEGGWALPGGGRTECRDTAYAVAVAISRMIGDKPPLTSTNPPVVLKRRKRVPWG